MGGVFSSDTRRLREQHARRLESEARHQRRLQEEVTALEKQRAELEQNTRLAFLIGFGALSAVSAAAVVYSRARSTKALAAFKERALRAHAESETTLANVQARSATDVAAAKKAGVASFAKELLDVADNLDRAMESSAESTSGAAGGSSTLKGIEMTRSQLYGVFAKRGIERVDPLGQPFDPLVHEAVGRAAADAAAGLTHNMVASVMQPGYTMGTRVLRPARVTVCHDPQSILRSEVEVESELETEEVEQEQQSEEVEGTNESGKKSPKETAKKR